MTAGLPIGWIFSSALLSLRLGPAIAFAPPFSMTRTPALLRVLLGLGLAACMVGGDPGLEMAGELTPGRLTKDNLVMVSGEIKLGPKVAAAFDPEAVIRAMWRKGAAAKSWVRARRITEVAPTTRSLRR
jgi:hypothetical protein